jgi:hypothetical protein
MRNEERRFQFETATSTFFKNLPVCPIDFATLEIERQETPAAIPRAFPFHGWPECPSLASKPFDWTNLATSCME